MAETPKRSWPWKKKLQEKAALTPESSPLASLNSTFFDEQDVSKMLSDHARVSDDAMMQLEHSESKRKQLSDKLHAAQTELTAKDLLVKQHSKVAEEAVNGWEKAEAETAELKQQIDQIAQQKLATEDRVSHLDGALKECMKQLRHVREEQEQRIHETIIKKTREYDNLRQEMEAKLAEVGQDLEDARSEVFERRREARETSIVLQESENLIAELADAKARSQEEVGVLRAQLEAMEKENASFKYELQILREELEIRNEERLYERKAIENAGKNQIENVKKIAKLEAECHRLRVLMRKKLPGPAALAQMKIEVDSLESITSGFDMKRSPVVNRSNRSSTRESISSDDFRDRRTSREAEALAERLAAMDDELKMLKEVLVKRDQELQASRNMCAKTASKLSKAEEQLEIALKRSKRENFGSRGFPLKEGSRVGDDSWDLMDDFAEMERLAMATGEEDCNEAADKAVIEKSLIATRITVEDKLVNKERELEEAFRLCKEVREQLSLAEEKVAALQSRNSANEALLVSLQAKLDMFCDKQGEDEITKEITKELEDLVEAQSISSRSAAHEAILYDFEERSQNGLEIQNRIPTYSSSRSTSDMRYEETDNNVESKATVFGSDLLWTAVGRVVQIVADLVQASGSKNEFTPTIRFGHEHGPKQQVQVFDFIQRKHPDLFSAMQTLIDIGNNLLQGKSDVVEFLTELAAVLHYLVCSHSRDADKAIERIDVTTNCPNQRENRELIWRGGSKEIVESNQHTPKCELDRDMLLLYKKVTALEGDLQGERQRHQEVVLKYLDLQQQLDRPGTGRTSSAGSITREFSDSEWGGSHDHYQSLDLALGDVQVGNDVQIQSSAEKLAECQRSIIGLGKQLKNRTSSACDSIDGLNESDAHCSVDRRSQWTGPGSNTPGHVKTDLSNAPLLLEYTSQVSSGRDSVPCSPFLDWRQIISDISDRGRQIISDSSEGEKSDLQN